MDASISLHTLMRHCSLYIRSITSASQASRVLAICLTISSVTVSIESLITAHTVSWQRRNLFTSRELFRNEMVFGLRFWICLSSLPLLRG